MIHGSISLYINGIIERCQSYTFVSTPKVKLHKLWKWLGPEGKAQTGNEKIVKGHESCPLRILGVGYYRNGMKQKWLIHFFLLSNVFLSTY